MSWIFAYGSLMWDYNFPVEETQPGVLDGYHRAFNKKSTRSWGTRDAPAPVLGLEEGGTCEGIALRLPENRSEEIGAQIDDREGASYEAQQKVVQLADDRTITARVWINQRNFTYIGDKPLDERAQMAVDAAGENGQAIDYVLNTQQELQNHGITDTYVDEFADLVVNLADHPHSDS